MYLTKKYLNQMCQKYGWTIDPTLEQLLLLNYSQKEDDDNPYPWTEQDLYEQIRKIVQTQRIR